MRIAVNTRLLLKNRLEGIGWFTHEVLSRIVKNHPEHEFFFFFDRPFDKEFIYGPNVTPIVISPPARHPFLFIVWFEWSVKKELARIKPDLFLSPDGYLSLSTPTPSLAVIHDLNFEHYPRDLNFLNRWYYKIFFPRFAKKAHRIATVSEFSKSDIVKQYGIDPNKIDVVYNGVNSSYHPAAPDETEKFKGMYTDGNPYFLFVGALHPRKNLARLFKAFDLFRKKANRTCKLVIAGGNYWWTREMRHAYDKMEFKDEVIFTGRLETKALNTAISGATALVYIPYFEGFGIPILEGFACGTPVITSNITSMPEVASAAALLVDPFNISEISNALQKIMEDEEFRNKQILKGRERVKHFSWDKTAEGVWSSILKSVDEKIFN